MKQDSQVLSSWVSVASRYWDDGSNHQKYDPYIGLFENKSQTYYEKKNNRRSIETIE